MCFGRKRYIKPIYEDHSIIVQVSDPFVVTKKTYVTVPNHYTAYLCDRGKRIACLESGRDNRLSKMGQENIGKQIFMLCRKSDINISKMDKRCHSLP